MFGDRGDGRESLAESTFVSHLIELRARLLRAVLAIVVVFAALLPFSNALYDWLAAPLQTVLPAGSHLAAIDVLSPFSAPLRLTLYAALMIAMPVLLYQAWAFVAPGLYKHERRVALPLLVSTNLLFYVGCAFAYFFLLPAMFKFLVATTPDHVIMTPDIGRYLDFVAVIVIASGLSFEVPVAVVILVLLGWVTPPQLREARPYAIIGIFVIAMLITPGDGLSMILLALPMCLLYEAGIVASRLVGQKTLPAPDA